MARNGAALQALTEDMELEASVIFTGFQSQPADYLSEFTSALKLLLEKPTTREQMADKAKQRFNERFSVAQMVDQYQKLYDIYT